MSEAPHVVRLGDRQAPQQVGIYPVSRRDFARAWAPNQSFDPSPGHSNRLRLLEPLPSFAHHAHQPLHALAVDPVTFLVEFDIIRREHRTAVRDGVRQSGASRPDRRPSSPSPAAPAPRANRLAIHPSKQACVVFLKLTLAENVSMEGAIAPPYHSSMKKPSTRPKHLASQKSRARLRPATLAIPRARTKDCV
jgi:hypothetical protein